MREPLSPRRLRAAVLISAAVLALSACRAGPPWQAWMFDGPPPVEGKEYNPLYVEGWVAGCETGASAAANHWYKFKYKFRQDAILAQNRVYYKGWKDAFDYCQRYIHQYDRQRFF